MTPQPGTDSGRVCAVIPAFKPGASLVTLVEAVRPQVDAVVVVDDTGNVGAAAEVLEACRKGASVVAHPGNAGIGAALNTGVRTLAPGPADLVLTLDQDSVVPAGYVEALRRTLHDALERGIRVGMVAPGHATGARVRTRSGPAGTLLGGEPIQSGLLVPAGVLAELGGFDEELFIDGVDSEFYLRARSRGYQVVVARSARLEHRIGTRTEAGRGAARIPLVVADDFRYYFQTRNLVTLLRRHAVRFPGWALRAVLKEVRHLTLTTVLVPGRKTRLGFAVRGLRDGLRGRLGPMDPRPDASR